MIRKLLVAATLLGASGAALAHGSYYDDPAFAFSFNTGYPGVSVTYASGAPYWGAYPYAPAPVVVVPPPRYRVVAPPPAYYRHGWKHHHGHRGGYGDDRGGYRYDHGGRYGDRDGRR